MRFRWLGLLLIIAVSLICGCTKEANELDEVKLQIQKFEMKIAQYEELNGKLDSISKRIEKIESDFDKYADNNKFNEATLLDTIEHLKEEVKNYGFLTYGNSIFNSDEIKVGDRVADMVLKEKNYHKAWRLLFSGTIQLTGDYHISENDSYWGRDIITFDVDDSDSNNILPRAKGDERHLWFVVSNYDEAYNMLFSNGESGRVTIIIDEYLIDLLQSDVVNEARIIEVINE